MFFNTALVAAFASLASAAVEPCPGECKNNRCLRAVYNGPTGVNSADCASYLQTTVTDAPSTTTVFTTIAGPAPTETLSVTAVETVTVPANLRRQDATSALPAYAEVCRNARRYASACSCIGATASTLTVSAPIATITSTVTGAPSTTLTEIRTVETATTTVTASPTAQPTPVFNIRLQDLATGGDLSFLTTNTTGPEPPHQLVEVGPQSQNPPARFSLNGDNNGLQLIDGASGSVLGAFAVAVATLPGDDGPRLVPLSPVIVPDSRPGVKWAPLVCLASQDGLLACNGDAGRLAQAAICETGTFLFYDPQVEGTTPNVICPGIGEGAAGQDVQLRIVAT